MVCISPPTKLVDGRGYGLKGVMGYQKYGLRGVRLYRLLQGSSRRVSEGAEGQLRSLPSVDEGEGFWARFRDGSRRSIRVGDWS